jgi:hypothetical protein
MLLRRSLVTRAIRVESPTPMSETQLHRVDGMGTTGPPKSTDVNCSVLRELHRPSPSGTPARMPLVATPALVAHIPGGTRPAAPRPLRTAERARASRKRVQGEIPSYEEPTVDALAPDADEGRGWLRKATGSCRPSFDPWISEWGNPAGVMPSHADLNQIGPVREPGELKHLSTSRKRKQSRLPE